MTELKNHVPSIAAPGDLYVFDTDTDIAIEWLVTREHPDNPDWILLVPVDDVFLYEAEDLVLPESVGRPMIVRVGQADWFPKSMLDQRLRVGTLPDDIIRQVRQQFAYLARGSEISPTDPSVDPEYEDHIADVEKARLTLLGRAAAN